MNELSLTHAMELAQKAARAAGQILKEMLLKAAVREKGPNDLVTDADIAAQEVTESIIHSVYPRHRFLGEESGTEIGSFAGSEDWTWVVDPLDGTTNYVHGFPNFAVSIGLVHGQEVQLGVVYDPMADELFEAVRGGGAKRNGSRIHASECSSVEEAMIAVSFPPRVQRDSPEIEQFLEILIRSQSVRRLGSAALNLCYVAMGRLDAYWANQLKPWDIAAGALIARESGAFLSGLNGNHFSVWKGEILVAATSQLGNQMLEILRINR